MRMEAKNSYFKRIAHRLSKRKMQLFDARNVKKRNICDTGVDVNVREEDVRNEGIVREEEIVRGEMKELLENKKM